MMVVPAMIGRQHWQAVALCFHRLIRRLYPQSDYADELSRSFANAQSGTASCGIGRSSHSELSSDASPPFSSTMQECHLAVARGLKGDLS
jgi:hypothetical protein